MDGWIVPANSAADLPHLRRNNRGYRSRGHRRWSGWLRGAWWCRRPLTPADLRPGVCSWMMNLELWRTITFDFSSWASFGLGNIATTPGMTHAITGENFPSTGP